MLRQAVLRLEPTVDGICSHSLDVGIQVEELWGRRFRVTVSQVL